MQQECPYENNGKMKNEYTTKMNESTVYSHYPFFLRITADWSWGDKQSLL